MKVLMVCRDASAGPYYRRTLPMRWFDRAGGDIECYAADWLPFPDVFEFDLVYARWFVGDLSDLLMFRAIKGKVPLIVDVDDTIFDTPTWFHTYHSFQIKALRDAYRELYSLADCITATTSSLRENLGRYVKTRIEIVPNSFDPRYRFAFSSDKGPEAPTVGWAGSVSHVEDLNYMCKVWTRLLDLGFRLEFIGAAPTCLDDNPAILRMAGPPYIDVESYFQTLAFRRWDVAVAPLIDCELNRCKSQIKVLEAQRFQGVPVVCSRLPCYSDVIEPPKTEGYLRKVQGMEPNEWVAAIVGALKAKQAGGIRRWRDPRFSLDTVGFRWEEVFRSVVDRFRDGATIPAEEATR